MLANQPPRQVCIRCERFRPRRIAISALVSRDTERIEHPKSSY
jgi:hypothetical protein